MLKNPNIIFCGEIMQKCGLLLKDNSICLYKSCVFMQR